MGHNGSFFSLFWYPSSLLSLFVQVLWLAVCPNSQVVPDEDNIPTRFFIFTTFTHSTFFSNMFHVNATCTYFKCKHMWSHGIRLINITMQLLLFASAQENINFSYITFITFHGAHCTVKADMRLSLKIYSCCKYIGQNARKVLYIAQLLRAKYFKPSATL